MDTDIDINIDLHQHRNVRGCPRQLDPPPNDRLGTVNLKSFVSKVLLRIKWKFELTVHFKHEMLGSQPDLSKNKTKIKHHFVKITSLFSKNKTHFS